MSLQILWSSTEDLYKRFELEPSTINAVNGIIEESAELIDALGNPEDNYEANKHIADEAVDLLVVAISGLLARGISYEAFDDAIYRVVTKNDSKNHDTHVVYNQKVTRKEKVSKNVQVD